MASLINSKLYSSARDFLNAALSSLEKFTRGHWDARPRGSRIANSGSLVSGEPNAFIVPVKVREIALSDSYHTRRASLPSLSESR